uniref:Uncharacterized protein n=1 Tax=Rhizophora mucronata TaxID=61149 RepID=A0A2P2PD65_RHIMU
MGYFMQKDSDKKSNKAEIGARIKKNIKIY